MNRLNGRVMVAKVNQSNSINNHAFTQKDEIKALDLTLDTLLKTKCAIEAEWMGE